MKTAIEGMYADGTRSERWLFARQAMPSARVRLFCFPYGGGGASIYRHWQTALGSDVEVCPVQPPGRENRYAEPAIDNINALIDAMLPALHPLFDRPVGFLGYCVGAGVAYSLAARCAERGHLDLRVLISCARRAPAHSSTIDRRHALPDGEFAAYVLSLGGTPRAVFEEPSLRAMALRLMRTDLRLSAGIVEPHDARLSCRIVAIGGQDDASEPPGLVADWRRVTRGSFAMYMLSGGHFFLNAQSEQLLKIVREEISSLTQR